MTSLPWASRILVRTSTPARPVWTPMSGMQFHPFSSINSSPPPRSASFPNVPKDRPERLIPPRHSMYKLGPHRSNGLELVQKMPIVEVDGNMAICDGGGGPLGHPNEYISLAVPGIVETCKYCGIRYTQKKKE